MMPNLESCKPQRRYLAGSISLWDDSESAKMDNVAQSSSSYTFRSFRSIYLSTHRIIEIEGGSYHILARISFPRSIKFSKIASQGLKLGI
jgi:hypothetical protein